MYIDDIKANPLGAGVVEIDESHFFKAKYNVGQKMILPQLWVFGAYDTASKRIVVEPVEKRDAETLIPIIQETVRPGTEIHSDLWGAYARLDQFGYRHFSVNHAEHFVDPVTGACTNAIEGHWGVCKTWMRRHSMRSRTRFTDTLREWAFRQNIGRTFHACWKAITE